MMTVVIPYLVRCIVKDSMSYIGQNLPSNSFIGYTTDTFAGDGSATTFTMSKAPFNESAVIVVINNVVQQPTEDFTVSGTTLTIDAAVASGDVIYATHTGGAIPIDQASSVTSNIAITTTGASNFNGGVTMGGTTPTLTIGDAGAEDTKIVFDGNAQDFHIGLDDSADSLKIGLGSALGTTSHMIIDATGAVTMPLQPCFAAVPASTQTNITSGTTIAFGTELHDLNGDFASNTFTSPVNGKYQLNVLLRLEQVDTAYSYFRIYLNTSNRNFEWLFDPNFSADLDYFSVGFSVCCDMDASDTATVSWEHGSGSNQVDISAASAFSGFLVA